MIDLAVDLQNNKATTSSSPSKLYDQNMLQYIDSITSKKAYIEGKEELKWRKIISIPMGEDKGAFDINMMDLRQSMQVDHDPNTDPVDTIAEQVSRALIKNVVDSRLDPILEDQSASEDDNDNYDEEGESDDEFDIVAQMHQVLAREEIERRAAADVEMEDNDMVMKAKIDPELHQLAEYLAEEANGKKLKKSKLEKLLFAELLPYFTKSIKSENFTTQELQDGEE